MPVLTPEQFGAKDGGSDNEHAFRALATEANRLGGAHVEFADNAVYGVFNTPPAANMDLWGANYVTTPDGTQDYALTSLFDFVGLKHLTMNWNGATVRPACNVNPMGTDQGYGGLKSYVVQLTDCSDVEIDGYSADDTIFAQRSPYYGLAGITIGVGCHGVTITNPRQRFGSNMIQVVRGPGVPLERHSRGITITNPEAEQVFYPASFQKNGHQVELKGGRFIGAGRSVTAYNVHGLNAEFEVVENHDGYDDVGIGVITDHTESLLLNTCSDVRIRYRNVEATTPKNSLTYVPFRQGTAISTPGVIRDVDFHFDIEMPAACTTPGVVIMKMDATGGTDQIIRGHTLEDVRWTGRMVNAPPPPAWAGNWAGENVARLAWFKN